MAFLVSGGGSLTLQSGDGDGLTGSVMFTASGEVLSAETGESESASVDVEGRSHTVASPVDIPF